MGVKSKDKCLFDAVGMIGGKKMNIAQAKEEIKHTVQAYLKKDDEGNYRIPAIRQRPILLIGPPGIGKTQIMEQIAEEGGIQIFLEPGCGMERVVVGVVGVVEPVLPVPPPMELPVEPGTRVTALPVLLVYSVELLYSLIQPVVLL